MPAILNEAVPATTQNVDAEIQTSLRSANKYAGMSHPHYIFTLKTIVASLLNIVQKFLML